jgi:hypothetical protein
LSETDRVWRERNTADAAGQLGFQDTMEHLVAPLARTLAQAGPSTPGPNTGDDFAEILPLVEKTRSMILSDYVGLVDIPLPEGVPVELLERERAARDELRRADRLESLGRPLDEIANLADQDKRVSRLQSRIAAHVRLVELWQEMATGGQKASRYAAYRLGQPLTMRELTRLARADPTHDVALASLYLDGANVHLFVVRAERPSPGWLSQPLGEIDLEVLRRRFVREIPGDPSGTRAQTWLAPLMTLFSRATRWIEGADTIVLSVPSQLWSLPLSVVADNAGWSLRERPLSVVVVPTLNLLPRFERPIRPTSQAALVVGNPTLDLKYADGEAVAIAEQLHVEPLTRENATRAATLNRLESARFIHIAAHGTHSEDDPLASGLALHDGVLTAREILERKISAEIVVMSACESGLLEEIPGQELLGLGQAFLIAGARTVVMSLWRVDDSSTADLMGRFYERYDRTGRAADALAHAARAIRSKPGYEHPYFWAPFVVMGDWRAPNRLDA